MRRQPGGNGLPGNRQRNAGGHIAQVVQWRKQLAAIQAIFRYCGCQGFGCCSEQPVSDGRCLCGQCTETDAGEDVDIVSLCDFQLFAVELDRLKGRTRRDQGAAAGPAEKVSRLLNARVE